MAKEFLYRGKKVEEIAKMDLDEFAKLVTSRERRKIKRGFTEAEKKLLERIRAGKKNIKTHCRDMLIIPEMLGQTIKVHAGKEWVVDCVLCGRAWVWPFLVCHSLSEMLVSCF